MGGFDEWTLWDWTVSNAVSRQTSCLETRFLFLSLGSVLTLVCLILAMFVSDIAIFVLKRDVKLQLETVSIAEPLQNRQHARLMLSTLERKGKREG